MTARRGGMRLGRSVLCDESQAYEFLERRAWPDGPVCPHCGGCGRIGRLNGTSTRIGTYKCYGCRQPFTVKIGTIFESSHVPLHVWLQAIYLIATSKARFSAHELHDRLGVTVKTACHMARRIDEVIGHGARPRLRHSGAHAPSFRGGLKGRARNP